MDYAATPAQTALDRYLKPRQNLDITRMNNLVGTKYMRQCRWQEAAEWLTRVPVSYYNNEGYAVYAVNRNPLLLLLNALPKRVQCRVIRLVLRPDVQSASSPKKSR